MRQWRETVLVHRSRSQSADAVLTRRAHRQLNVAFRTWLDLAQQRQRRQTILRRLFQRRAHVQVRFSSFQLCLNIARRLTEYLRKGGSNRCLARGNCGWHM